MKVLLFTHEQDIDGMGSIILAKNAFDEIDYITCKTASVDINFKDKIKSKSIYNYDQIYMTDICLDEETLKEVENDVKLKDKFLIFDHHKTVIDNKLDRFDFVNVKVTDSNGKTCGTSLFYEYLISNGLINRNKFLNEFVELTRQYDTWEWFDIYHNEKARKLHIIFEQVGFKEYIKQLNNMSLSQVALELSLEQEKIVASFDKKLKKDLIDMLNKIEVKNILIKDKLYKIGMIEIMYKYRNDLAEFVRSSNKVDIDLLMLIINDRDQISYRKVRDVDVSLVANYFGGGGHKEAASSPKDNGNLKKILKLK